MGLAIGLVLTVCITFVVVVFKEASRQMWGR